MEKREAPRNTGKTTVALLSSFLGVWPTLSWDGKLHPELAVEVPFSIPQEKLSLLHKYRLVHREGRVLCLNKPVSEDYLSVILYCLDWYYDFTATGISLEKLIQEKASLAGQAVPA